jgi:hypothetical protein
MTAMLESLESVYVATVDVDAAETHHVEALSAVPLWTVRAMAAERVLRAQR